MTLKKNPELHYYRVTVQYFGEGLVGWQVQKGKKKTVQGEIMKALSTMCHSKKFIKTLGSGRTDAGVHALEQVVKISIPLKIEPVSLLKGLNSLLPDQIKIINAQVCNKDFHPILDAQWKEYVYLFTTKELQNPFSAKFMASVNANLDRELMQKAAKMFEGEHDFINYFCKGTDISSTVRQIFECELKYLELDFSKGLELFPPHYMLRIKGNGFLKQMVRLIMGTIWEVGKKKVSLDQLAESLREPKNMKLGAVAPPQGLFLRRVYY